MPTPPEIKAILFDLDGTLLSMDQAVFFKEYLERLADFLTPHGIAHSKMIDAVLGGTESMIHNTVSSLPNTILRYAKS